MLIANLYQNGLGRVGSMDKIFLMGWVGLGHLHCGSGRVGSKNLDPCPTLSDNIRFVRIFARVL